MFNPRLGRSSGGGHGNPLQSSCLENSKDRGAWRSIVHGVAKGQTRLSRETNQPGQEPARPALRPTLRTAPELFLQHQPRDPLPSCFSPSGHTGKEAIVWEGLLPMGLLSPHPQYHTYTIARVLKQLQKFLTKEM